MYLTLAGRRLRICAMLDIKYIFIQPDQQMLGHIGRDGGEDLVKFCYTCCQQ